MKIRKARWHSGITDTCRHLAGLFLLIVSMQAGGQYPGGNHGRLSILFIGDIMGHDSQIASAYDESAGTYDYHPVFRHIAPIIKSHDIAIGNLEVTLGGLPYKGYPLFSSPAALAAAAREAGIGVLVTANNHSVDRGLAGINSTIGRLDSLGIIHTGTYRTASERDSLVPCIIEKNGIKLALLNYTYGTNGIKVPFPAVVDLIDRKVMETDIGAAINSGVDATIVFMHWGTEYDTVPSEQQTELAQWLFDKGVMMVIGSHPHVIQPAILTPGELPGKDRLVVYSLGNFISNQRNRRTDGGMMVSVLFEKGSGSARISSAGYILTWVYTPVENGKRKFYVLPAARHDSDNAIPADIDSKSRLRIFLNDSGRLLQNSSRGLSEIR